MNTDQDVLNRASKGDPVALTRAMVAIPSVNPVLEKGGDGEEEMARQCGMWLEGWGYEVALMEVEAGRWNVVAKRGHGGRTLILNGHLDTVGVAGMTMDPFGAELRENQVWGRGACDMKGGLAIILATAATLSRADPQGELVVALTADEEYASVGMQSFVDTGPEAAAAVVCEPTGLAVMPAHKGFLWIDAHFKGKAAHGSRPAEGVDAIAHAGYFLAALKSLEADLLGGPQHPLLGYPSFHAGTIAGGSVPPVYPDSCKLVLERRTLPGEDNANVMKEFQEVLDEVKAATPEMEATLTPGLSRPATEVPENSPLVQGLLESLRAEGVPPRVEAMTAWVDAALLNEAGIPAVCFGPGSLSQAHGAREWVPIGELEQGARVLTRFADRYFHG